MKQHFRFRIFGKEMNQKWKNAKDRQKNERQIVHEVFEIFKGKNIRYLMNERTNEWTQMQKQKTHDEE